MRRPTTQVSVWTSVADLMTVLAVMIFTISFVQCKKQVSELTVERDSLKDQGSTLTTELEENEREVSILRAELAEGREQVSMLGRELGEKEEQISADRREEITKKFGHPSCYGEVEDQPRAVIAVTILPGGKYRVEHSWTEVEHTKLRDGADVLSGRNPAVLSKNDFEHFVTTLARTTTNWSDEGCRYFARLEPRDEGVTGDEYVIRWTDDIRPHFAGLVNPGVIGQR